MQPKITILGCGASGGVPAIGNVWGKCDPNEPRNQRSRCSIAVQSATTTLVVDSGPDFRMQINRAEIEKIDAILYTHAHGDHINGLDELTSLRRRDKKPMDVYGMPETIEELQQRFNYLFTNDAQGLYPASAVARGWDNADIGTTMRIGDIEFTAFRQDHGTCDTLGFRFGDIAYSTDMVRLNDTALDVLKGIKTWIVDGAGYHQNDNKVHIGIEGVQAYARTLGIEKVYLTHLSLIMDYDTLLKELPDGIFPAYDGLIIK